MALHIVGLGPSPNTNQENAYRLADRPISIEVSYSQMTLAYVKLTKKEKEKKKKGSQHIQHIHQTYPGSENGH